MTKPRLAYVMSRFPHLSETFILREMVQLERRGWSVALYPLIQQAQPVLHPDAITFGRQARQLPFMSRSVVAANVAMFLEEPRRCLSTIAIALRDNCRSPRFLVRTLALLPKCVYAARLMRNEGVDHLHAHYATHPALAAWVIHRLTGIPYSVTVHGADVFVNRTMVERKLGDASFIVAISEYNRDYLLQVLGPWAVDRVRVIPCGVPGAGQRTAANPYRPGERFEIVSVARLSPEKALDVLVAACARLASRRVPFRCRIVGEGPERRALESLIKQAGLTATVELMGARTEDEVESVLGSAHCYVQSSVWLPSGKGEGLPVAIMEAMAAELPVVASAIAGIPELVRDGDTGWLVPPGEPEAVAEAIESIRLDPAGARAVAARGRELVCRECDLDRNVERLGEEFERAHAQRRRNDFSAGSSLESPSNLAAKRGNVSLR